MVLLRNGSPTLEPDNLFTYFDPFVCWPKK